MESLGYAEGFGRGYLAMAQSQPSGTNTFIPQMVRDNLIVGYSRNIDSFSINKYTQIVPTPKNQAYYLFVDGSTAVRLTSSDIRNHVWPDGQERPAGLNDVAEFEFKPIATFRHSYEYTLGNMAVDQADWDIVSVNSGMTAVRAMTARTQNVVSTLVNASWGNNTATATAAGGGYFNAGTSTNPIFKKIVNYARRAIRQATYRAVQHDQVMLVMSAKAAENLSESAEIVDYLKSSPFAQAAMRGDTPNLNSNAQYGLPDRMYGCPIIIEDAQKVTSKRGNATTTTAEILTNTKMYFVSRVGGLVLPYGGTNFSTLQTFVREEMTMEMYPDAKNRFLQGFVTDDYNTYVVAPASGFEVTAITAS